MKSGCSYKIFTFLLVLFCESVAIAKIKDANELTNIVSTLEDVTLKNAQRAPLLFWNANELDHSDQDLLLLHRKGILPSLPIIDPDIEKAEQFKSLGVPIYLMQGQGSGTWPYRLQSNYDRMQDNNGHEYPSFFDLRGWFLMSNELRASMATYKETGANVKGVIYDFELYPRGTKLARFSESAVLRGQLSHPDAKYSDEEYDFFLHDYESALHSAYMAAPVREYFPQALVTNWGVYCNSPQDPVVNKTDIAIRNQSIGLFNAGNTFAYAWDAALRFHQATANSILDDNGIYFWSMLKQTSEHGRNQQKYCPMMSTTTWVSSYVRDDHSKVMQPMERSQYQNALLHLWFRGVDAMFIFNPYREERPNAWKYDLVDTHWVYKRVEPYWQALQNGRILNLKLDDIAVFDRLWSGVEFDGTYTIVTTCFIESCAFDISLDEDVVRSIQSEKGTYIHQFTGS